MSGNPVQNRRATMSLSLAGALTRLRGPVANGSNQPLTTSSEVWAVSRFNQDDSTLEVFWSERNLPGVQVSDSAGVRNYGSHAEPVFIRKFPELLATHGTPAIVELFLSRSACPSGSVPMSANGNNYSRGCGPKLVELARQYSNIEFFVVHDVVYAGSPNRPSINIRTESKNSLASYAVIPNLHAFSFTQFQPYLLA
jgi:hypothetical protein